MIRWTIRSKLIAVILSLTVFSILLVGFRTYQISQSALRQRIGEGLRQKAEGMIEQIDRLLFERYRNVQNWSTHELLSDVLTRDAKGRIQVFLQTMKKEYGLYADLLYVNKQGDIIAASKPSLLGRNVGNESWFQDSYRETGVKTHPLKFSKLLGTHVVTFSAPIRTDLLLKAPQIVGGTEVNFEPTMLSGELGGAKTNMIGVLAAFLDWSEVLGMVNRLPIHESDEQDSTAYAMLIDSHGVALTQPYFENRAVMLHENLMEGHLQAADLAAKGQSGYLVEEGRYGNLELVGYASSKGYRDFKGFGWSLLVFQNTSKAFAPIEALKFQIAGLTLFMVILVSIIAVLIARGISHPIITLAEIAKSVGKGDFSQRALITSADEVGTLARAFNEMTAGLQKANQVLLDAKNYTDNIINSTIDALVVMDMTGLIQTCNPALLELLGYEEEELRKKPIETLLKKDKWLNAQFLKNLYHGKMRNTEMFYQKKNGEQISMLVSATVMNDSKNQSQGIVIIAKNITEYKQLENQFLHAQKMEAVGRLAGGVAHDFNNMLTVISGYSSRLLRKLKKEDKPYKDMEQIVIASQHSANLVSQLLTFSHRQVFSPKPLKLDDLIGRTSRMLHILCGESITLHTHTDENLGTIEADHGQMEQVVANMIVNARDAMPEGGTITLETRNIEVTAEKPHLHGLKIGRYVLLSIQDTGTGIPEDVKKHIFEPFFTTKGKGKGTGLGLATCYGIIMQSQGKLHLESSPEGTTFFIYFPESKEIPSLSEDEFDSEGLPGGTEAILVVEDEAPVRKLACDVLRERGYTVLEATNGREALKFLENKGKVDLLFSDLVMPELGGKELALRLINGKRDLKILLSSAYTQDGLQELSALGKQIAFLPKPYNEHSLSHAVRALLDVKL